MLERRSERHLVMVGDSLVRELLMQREAAERIVWHLNRREYGEAYRATIILRDGFDRYIDRSDGHPLEG